jgi:hypothetical protein
VKLIGAPCSVWLGFHTRRIDAVPKSLIYGRGLLLYRGRATRGAFLMTSYKKPSLARTLALRWVCSWGIRHKEEGLLQTERVCKWGHVQSVYAQRGNVNVMSVSQAFLRTAFRSACWASPTPQPKPVSDDRESDCIGMHDLGNLPRRKSAQVTPLSTRMAVTPIAPTSLMFRFSTLNKTERDAQN